MAASQLLRYLGWMLLGVGLLEPKVVDTEMVLSSYAAP
jgi:hypothetical protein